VYAPYSGFGGLVVSVLASGTQDHRRKNPQRAFLQRGSKAICPISPIFGVLKTPENYVEVEFSGEICQPFSPISVSRYQWALSLDVECLWG
jgi:hypothetical protein